MRSRSPSKRSYRPSSTSPTVVASSTAASDSPPVTGRSCVGILTVIDIAARILCTDADGCLLDVTLERRHRRLDLVRLEAAAHRVEGLQALAGDQHDHALVGLDVAALRELAQHRGRHAAGRLREDAG